MARTPLLQSLIKQFRQAQMNLASPPSSDGITSPYDPTRRAWLGQVGVALAISALPSQVFAAKKKHRRIAIVGGGMAGLHCALTLKDHGIPSTLYEAAPRLGGRMFSNPGAWEEGQVSEWCGELIDSGHETMRSLVKRFGLKLDHLVAAQPKGSEDTFYFHGAYYKAEQFQKDIQPVLKAVEMDMKGADYPTTYKQATEAGKILDAMSVRAWIESRVPGGMSAPLGQLMDLAYATEYGAETSDQSALNLLYLLGFQPAKMPAQIFGESDEAHHIRGGNDQLPRAMAKEIGSDHLRTGMKLTVLQKLSPGTYGLTFAKSSGLNEEVEADQVVLALPFSVLRDVDLSQAGFDELKMRAIRELGCGQNGKTQLQFQKRLWNSKGAWPAIGTGSTYSDTGYQSSWEVTRGQKGTSGILNFFSGGSTTLSQKVCASDQPFTTTGNALARQDAETALAAGEKVFPGLNTGWNGRFTQSVPHLHPLMKASYAYYRVGQFTSLCGYEGVRQGQVFFCGDHTSLESQGYMEGAASEGERAAREILKG